MEQQCGRRICLKPSRAQVRTMYRMCAVSRRAYNWKLGDQNKIYEEAKARTPEGEKVECSLGTPIDWHKEWCVYKKLPENKWMTEVSKYCGQEALRDLGNSWKRFFKGLGDHPQFHKYGIDESFRCSGGVFIGRDFVQLPTLGRIKLKEKNYVKIPDGVEKIPLTMATVSVDASGKWFVSFAYKVDIIPLYENVTNIDASDVYGVDFGVKDLAITNDGFIYKNPKAYRHAKERLRRCQRAVSRKKLRSKNRKKCRKKLARIYRRITNIRINAAHQFTTDITKNKAPRAIVIEDLKPKNMVKNHNLASAILDANFGRMRQFLTYKCAWLGILLLVAPQFFASSKYCSHCGQYYKADLKLSDREWVCPVCGHHHHRDINAARNLQFYGLWLLNLVVTNESAARYAVSGNPSTNACPHGNVQCVTYREGVAYASPRDMRLQFFGSREQCMAMKQEIMTTYFLGRNR